MQFQESTTVGDVATSAPGSLKVFERYGIDYCCHGKRPLRQACAESGITMAELQHALELAAGEAPEGGTDWRAEPLRALGEHLQKGHHGFTREALARQRELAAAVWRAHGLEHPELATVLSTSRALEKELLEHLAEEEAQLFPWASAVSDGTPRVGLTELHAAAYRMELEHEACEKLLTKLHSATRNYRLPAGACAQWRELYESFQALEADLHLHLHLENNILVPRMLELTERCAKSA